MKAHRSLAPKLSEEEEAQLAIEVEFAKKDPAWRAAYEKKQHQRDLNRAYARARYRGGPVADALRGAYLPAAGVPVGEQDLKQLLRLRSLKAIPQFRINWARYDFALPSIRLLIEVDSAKWHSSRDLISRDRAKNQLAAGRGWILARLPSSASREELNILLDAALRRAQLAMDKRNERVRLDKPSEDASAETRRTELLAKARIGQGVPPLRFAQFIDQVRHLEKSKNMGIRTLTPPPAFLALLAPDQATEYHRVVATIENEFAAQRRKESDAAIMEKLQPGYSPTPAKTVKAELEELLALYPWFATNFSLT